jgi:hypothetical protein
MYRLLSDMSNRIHEYVVERLAQSDLEEVSRATGVAESTLYKIMKRIIPNPGINKVEPVYFYFRKTEGRRLRERVA